MKSRLKKFIGIGMVLGLIFVCSTIYTLFYNEGRFIYPMDMAHYVFTIKDVPMIISIGLVIVYILYGVMWLFKHILLSKQEKSNYTRKLNPHLGLLGILGFLGFSGFWTYSQNKVMFPFIFFAFFGFFGFFFEGKLSHILEDELYQNNKREAEIKAYRIGFSLLFIVIWLVGMGMFTHHIEWMAIFLLISMSLIYALVLFLSQYLLYRLERDM